MPQTIGVIDGDLEVTVTKLSAQPDCLRAPPVFHCNDDPPQSKQTNSPRKIFHLIPECTTTRVRLSAAAGRLHLSCKKKKRPRLSRATPALAKSRSRPRQRRLNEWSISATSLPQKDKRSGAERSRAEPSLGADRPARVSILVYLISSGIR